MTHHAIDAMAMINSYSGRQLIRGHTRCRPVYVKRTKIMYGKPENSARRRRDLQNKSEWHFVETEQNSDLSFKKIHSEWQSSNFSARNRNILFSGRRTEKEKKIEPRLTKHFFDGFDAHTFQTIWIYKSKIFVFDTWVKKRNERWKPPSFSGGVPKRAGLWD
jgi:hypothetical protein